MKFVVDECTGPTVARWLRQEGFDVISIVDDARGAADDQVLSLAHTDARVLITSDKDFGELVFREKRPHHGIVLLRLNDQSSANSIADVYFRQAIPWSINSSLSPKPVFALPIREAHDLI